MICLIASAIGGICGIGGGIVIKPVLDTMHIMSVSEISFLSGLTVLSMSIISIFRQRKYHLVEPRTSTLLAIGAILGGVAGNVIFQRLKELVGKDQYIGMIQAIILTIVTALTLMYNIFWRQSFPSFHIRNFAACVGIGMCMGAISSFLGIGGGPINLMALYFAFSMDTKKAAACSLYIIMLSQTASLLTSVLKHSIPAVQWTYLIAMVLAGIIGGVIGSQISRQISVRKTNWLLNGLLCVIICICIHNAIHFAG